MDNKIKVLDIYDNPITEMYQWDVNQVLKITNIFNTENMMVHFTSRTFPTAFVVAPSIIDEHSITVSIPNILFKYPEAMFIYLYSETGEKAYRTSDTIKIPIIKRAVPDDYEYSENVHYTSIELLSAEINEMKVSLEKTNSDLTRSVGYDVWVDTNENSELFSRYVNISPKNTVLRANFYFNISNDDGWEIKNFTTNPHPPTGMGGVVTEEEIDTLFFDYSGTLYTIDDITSEINDTYPCDITYTISEGWDSVSSGFRHSLDFKIVGTNLDITEEQRQEVIDFVNAYFDLNNLTSFIWRVKPIPIRIDAVPCNDEVSNQEG